MFRELRRYAWQIHDLVQLEAARVHFEPEGGRPPGNKVGKRLFTGTIQREIHIQREHDATLFGGRANEPNLRLLVRPMPNGVDPKFLNPFFRTPLCTEIFLCIFQRGVAGGEIADQLRVFDLVSGVHVVVRRPDERALA